MDHLPTELQEQIINSLLSKRERNSLTELPISTEEERRAIYNVRLTSQRLRAITWPAFIRVIEDVPTECSECNLERLDSLVAVPNAGSRLSCLALDIKSTCVGDPLEHLVSDMHEQQARESLFNRLYSVTSKMPNLRHVIFQSGTMQFDGGILQGCGSFDFASQVVRDVLIAASLDGKLESLHLLSCPLGEPLLGRRLSPPDNLIYPHLEHLTLCKSQHVSQLGLHDLSKLRTLQFIADDREELSMACVGMFYSPSALQECTIRGRPSFVSVEKLLAVIQQLLRLKSFLPRITICDVDIIADISFDQWDLPEDVQISKVVFNNVNCCWTDDITNSGPSDPKPITDSSKIVRSLKARAEVVVIFDS